MNKEGNTLMGDNIVIWGTGVYGEMAYYYYRMCSKILYFVDSNDDKWNSKFHNYEINNPDKLLDEGKIRVVVALKNGKDEVKQLLKDKYGISDVELFQLNIYADSTENAKIKNLNRLFVVRFSGGLGNQMFQYALAKNLDALGNDVYAELGYTKMIGNPGFKLEKVFPQINLEKCNENDYRDIVNTVCIDGLSKQFILYKENTIYEVENKVAASFLLDMSGGILDGLFQTAYFTNNVKNELIKDFSFEIKEDKLSDLCNMMAGGDYVSIHVRRGDYLDEKVNAVYGGICTEQYYRDAINYITQHDNNVCFCFFSDDIEWVKENYKISNALYISSDMFDSYEDWYDMCLMSHCKYNIIANSTFSWWGAWLNQHDDKIVIAPERWINGCDYQDIYPNEWIRISAKGE